ncbi:MAG: YkgJ family cysteine cluster protein [Bryobacteraceae bacterium]
MHLQQELVVLKTGNGPETSSGHAESDQTEARDLQKRVSEGLFYVHSRLSQNTNKILESSAFLYALIELLEERKLLSIGELDERKGIVAERLAEQLKQKGLGVILQDPEQDKYAFKAEARIACEDRVQFCHAACCRMRFALSKQDVFEGIIRWELGRPYLIEHNSSGYCTHFEAHSCRCTVRENRPVPCRGYDCRNDKRIWLDFEGYVVNPDIDRADWPECLETESADGMPSK